MSLLHVRLWIQSAKLFCCHIACVGGSSVAAPRRCCYGGYCCSWWHMQLSTCARMYMNSTVVTVAPGSTCNWAHVQECIWTARWLLLPLVHMQLSTCAVMYKNSTMVTVAPGSTCNWAHVQECIRTAPWLLLLLVTHATEHMCSNV